MPENPYEPSGEIESDSTFPNQFARFLAYAVLIPGVLVLIQGIIAFYFRLNVLTGTRYGPSLIPVYLIFSGIGICVVGLAIKTYADRK